MIAIISPKRALYSETFIRQHINLLSGNKCVYYGGLMPSVLDGHGPINDNSLLSKAAAYMNKKLFYSSFSLNEYYLYRSLKNKHVRLVLAEYGPVGAGVYNVCKALNIPLIVHFHGADAFEHEMLNKHLDQYKKMFEYASWVIVVSEPMYKQLVKLGCPERKLVKNIYGPDPGFQQIMPQPSTKKLVGIGRFVDKKAPYYTILAFSKALEKHPDAILHLVGNGPLLNACKNLVSFLGLQQKVVFEGILSPEQIMELLRSAYAFVQHSIIAEDGDSEGSPVAIIEASAAGLPVVATKHAGIPEVIIDKETGLLVEEHDVTAMSEKLVFLFDNEVIARAYGEAGKKRVQEHFSLKKHIATIDDLIAKSMYKPSGGA